MNTKKTKIIIIYILLGVGAAAMLWPFIQMILGSFMTTKESMSYPPKIIPGQLNLSNYFRVFEKMPFLVLYLNSLTTTVLRTLGNLTTCTMAGYAFAKFEFKGKKIIFSLILAILMVPGQIFLLPQYMTMNAFGWLDQLIAIWMPNIFSAYGIFLMRQFFLSVPDELLEAARIDGSNPFDTFIRIAVPLVKPGLLVYGIQVIVASWNDLLWPLVVVSSINKLTLPVGMSFLRGQYTVDTPALMAAAVMAVVPLLVIFIVFQRHFKNLNISTGIK